MMKVAVMGATGMIGSKLLEEAFDRGHIVTGISRHASKLPSHDRILPVEADVLDTNALARAFSGQDAILHAFAPPRLSVEERVEQQRAGTQSIIAAAKSAGVRRILAVGGAGTLEVAPGVQNKDRPEFPASWEGGVKSTALIKGLLAAEPDLDWTFLSPSHEIFVGERTGKFRLGLDQMLIDANGKSSISVADYAIAMIDELENPKHSRRRFTVGY
jgi:putative NADH-flavin reductase